MRKTSTLLTIGLLMVLIFSSGCNMPRSEGSTSETPDVTQAYQTVQARLTEAASITPLASFTSAPTQTPTGAGTPSAAAPSPTNTAPATSVPTKAVKLCDQAEAGVPIDITIPDDTKMAPGQSFTKVWRLRNAGTCAWSKNYSIAVFSGEPMSAPSSVPMPKAIDPGQTVDISVDLIAPTSSGAFQGNWKLKNAEGTWFGIGPGGNSPFWVRISVAQGTVTVTPPTSTATGTAGTAYPPPTVSYDPPVLVAGVNTMVANDRLNLDSNTLNNGGEDITLKPNAQGRLLLNTLGNAGLAGYGAGKPTFGECQSANPGPASVTVRNIPSGFYICYRTEQGLYGWMRIASFAEATGTLNFQVNTWALP